MRVYVMGRATQAERVGAVGQAIEAVGHSITFKWWGPEGGIKPDWTLEPERAREIATTERSACWAADVGVLVWEDTILGAAIETGMILSDMKPLIIMGAPRESVFWYLPHVHRASSVEGVVEYLAELQSAKADDRGSVR